jgi:hypothetical protein
MLPLTKYFESLGLLEGVAGDSLGSIRSSREPLAKTGDAEFPEANIGERILGSGNHRRNEQDMSRCTAALITSGTFHLLIAFAEVAGCSYLKRRCCIMASLELRRGRQTSDRLSFVEPLFAKVAEPRGLDRCKYSQPTRNCLGPSECTRRFRKKPHAVGALWMSRTEMDLFY